MLLLVLTFPRRSSPSTAAQAGGVREHCLSPNRFFDSGELAATRIHALSRHLYVPVRHATPGLSEERREPARRVGEATGWAFLWLLSCRDKRVTRCRAASGIKAVKASPEAIPINPWIPACTGNCSYVSSISAIHGGHAGMTNRWLVRKRTLQLLQRPRHMFAHQR
jgi:hypothetical protein